MAGPNRVVDKIDKTAEIGKPIGKPITESMRAHAENVEIPM